MESGMRRAKLIGGVALACIMMSGASAQSDEKEAHLKVLDEACLGCHNFDDYAGGLDLELVVQDGDFVGDARDWELVIRKMRAGMMPPPGQPRPEVDGYTALGAGL